MTLDELQQQAEKDLKMDDLELADESLKSASLHQKYLLRPTKILYLKQAFHYIRVFSIQH